MADSFEYWVNVYANFVDLGGSTQEQADLVHQELWEEECPRLACRLLRYVPGKRLKDITPRVYTPEAGERQGEMMREYWRKRKAAEAQERALLTATEPEEAAEAQERSQLPATEPEEHDTTDGSF